MDDNKITCPRCEGSGLCIECEGKGFIPCPDCNENISPSCKKCSGTGKIFCSPKCEVCDGKGYIDYSTTSYGGGELPKHREESVVVSIIPQRPVATFVLLVLSVLCTLCSGILFGEGNLLWYLGVFIPVLAKDGEWWRFITSMFLHGNFWHLAFNMYFLYCVGPIIEQLMGTKKYLMLYFISGILGSVLSMILMPKVASVGASGALFGLFASYFALHARFRCFPEKVMKNLYFWLGVNILFGVFMPSINMWAHVGGFISGFLFIYLFPNPDKRNFKR